ncbi:MAG: thioredoxin domain-containing protein [Porphyromonas sp.]|nr:thioredoxin domain-containing protein [Porphyromonas sp.]
MRKNILTLGLMALMSLGAMACTSSPSQAGSVAVAQTAQTDKPVKNIDAKFMREHIFDYKANPTKFVFKGKRPAILDFYADWCGPCRQLSPRLEALAKKYAGKIDVYKINVDNETELSRVFGVQSIPMLLFIKPDGSTPSVSQGALSTEQLEAEIQALLK